MIQHHVDDKELYPHSMFGFRVNLLTQDVLLQINEEIINTSLRAGKNVIMALDIKGVFHNVSHEGIMEGLNKANCDKRIHDYVKAFLTKCTAAVGLGDLRSDVFTTPRKGTPPGSVISPTLFNIAMIGLARRLRKIDGIQHAIHADDITVWVNRGSLGQKQEKVQEAAKCVEEYVRERGLACSTEK
ncbi:putative nicotine oxidoreductase [Dermacentor variabilis]|uniref:putative nicotine oxidoreductase n=1 Tax=Dermacentor variabilis TaxID=34621 RepID=UPI003F5BADF5